LVLQFRRARQDFADRGRVEGFDAQEVLHRRASLPAILYHGK